MISRTHTPEHTHREHTPNATLTTTMRLGSSTTGSTLKKDVFVCGICSKNTSSVEPGVPNTCPVLSFFPTKMPVLDNLAKVATKLLWSVMPVPCALPKGANAQSPKGAKA